jgi:carboxyl-terminal processing protease
LCGVCIVIAAVSGITARAGQDWKATALASFDVVWQTVNDTYHDPTFGGLNWKTIRDELRPKAELASTAEDARGVIRDMLSRLRQSHFSLLTSSPDAETLPGDASVLVDFRVGRDGVVITRAPVGSGPYRSGMRPGDRLMSIDGQPVDGRIATAGGTDERARRLAVWQPVFRALHGAAGSKVRLSVRDPSGRVKDIDVERSREAGEAVTFGNLPPMHVTTTVSDARTPNGGLVGVIAFNMWMTTVAQPFAAAVDKYRQADGIVVDLRGNPGGLAEMIRGIAGHFLPTPELLGRVHMRGVELEFRANPRRSTADGRRVEPFAKAVAILVDELSASASECFAGGLQSLGRARVFGSRTMGQALPASTRQLPNGDVLMYAIGDFVTSTGQRLEGAGVLPDEDVALSIDVLAAGRDAALERALAWIDAAAVRPPARQGGE